MCTTSPAFTSWVIPPFTEAPRISPGAIGLRIDNLASGHQCRTAVENVKQVGVILVQFTAAVPAAKSKHGVVMRIFFEGLAGRTVALRGQLPQVLCPLQELSGRPYICFHSLCICPQRQQQECRRNCSFE